MHCCRRCELLPRMKSAGRLQAANVSHLPSSVATPAVGPSIEPTRSTRLFPIRVRYVAIDELTADDICDHLEKFGPLCDFAFLEDAHSGFELARLFFTDPSSRVEALKQAQHRILTSEDRKTIGAKVYVKLSDNSM